MASCHLGSCARSYVRSGLRASLVTGTRPGPRGATEVWPFRAWTRGLASDGAAQLSQGGAGQAGPGWGLKRLAALGASILGGTFAGVTVANQGDWNQSIFDMAGFSIPLLHALDPERAHEITVGLASKGFAPREFRAEDECLRTTVWGRQVQNPLGLSAGFDKNAQAMDAMFGMGFGLVEIGSVTPKPQEGNRKPRIFRLSDQKAIVNRCGCNSDGIAVVEQRLATFRRSSPYAAAGQGRLLGVNVAKNRQTGEEDAAGDYAEACASLSRHADYVVLNVSSPNTPGLRRLQGRRALQVIISSVQAALRSSDGGEGTLLLVKVAPDLSEQDKRDVAAAVLATRVDGIIVSNTSVQRPGGVLSSAHSGEEGGLSGAPLREMSTQLVREMYELTSGEVPIVGCGGVSSGLDAYKKIRAGASLVQLYSAMVFEGPAVVPRIKSELAGLLRADGFESVEQAVGVDAKVSLRKRWWW